MRASLKMDFDERTTNEIHGGFKKCYYQSMIYMIGDDGISCNLWLNLDINKKLARGILKEIQLKRYFKIIDIIPKSLFEDEEPADVYDTDIFYVENGEMVFVKGNKKFILPITNPVIDSILMQNFEFVNQ
jgi:hypothetical protein